ncbi:MAG: capsule assembly Wzi family protein [Spirochaetaceae bacterium]|nr:capsule assembly Wzi family protein [Spirochaetaceae bacterium]MCF7949354.1 capsule assembly Wzi family protein [Spirochaetia bacterium]
MKKIIPFVLFICVAIFSWGEPFAFDLEVDNKSLVSAEKHPPHWLTANSWGVFEKEKPQSLTGFIGSLLLDTDSIFTVRAKFSGAAAVSENPDFIVREAFAAINAGVFLLRGGIIRDTVGELPNEHLSTGSFAVSANARPIPRISFLSNDFVDIPFTGGYLQTNFGISHGWFTDPRYVEDTLLHEKWFYVGTKKENAFRLYAGLVHEAMWGGDEKVAGTLPMTFENFLRVFFNRSGGVDASTSDQINKAGNALGIWDFGISLDYQLLTLHTYHHRPFEDGSGMRFENATDGLWGIAVELKRNRPPWPKWIVYEGIDTTDQSGDYHDLSSFGVDDVILGGNDSYYQHGVYSSGWTHYGRVIGNPLFILSGEDESTRIVSDRMRGLHLGVEGNLPIESLSYRILFTYMYHRDYGDGASNYYSLIEFDFREAFGIDSLGLTMGTALDLLDTSSDTFGMRLKVSWNF